MLWRTVRSMDLMMHYSDFLLPKLHQPANKPVKNYALVVLNQHLPRFMPRLWAHANLRICADGGANRIFDEMFQMTNDQDKESTRNRYVPEIIEGDMDSIRPEVKLFYSSQGIVLIDKELQWASHLAVDQLDSLLVDSFLFEKKFKSLTSRPEVFNNQLDLSCPLTILLILLMSNNISRTLYSSKGSKISDKSHNQETTDLHKCISRIHHRTPDHEKPNLCVLVTGALGGRFDHEAANINVLYLFSDMRIVLLSDDCLIRLLPKTHHHEVYIESSVEGPHCGLFPVGAPSTSTSTTGLKWNLSEAKMRFGSLISTSNIVQAEKVTVQSDADLLWTISLQNLT